ncbi:MAG: CBS and ACT domain-containing protein, partial [Candidatus Binatia bacterium]
DNTLEGDDMLVGKRMSKAPVTVTSQDSLATAQNKMRTGRFRRLPVVEDGKLLGIITDRDIREHKGFLEQTKVNAVMTTEVVTVTPEITLEEAAKVLLKHKIGGLPVLEQGKLAGIITTSDIVQAFLDVMGASEEGAARIDLLLEDEDHNLSGASKTIAMEGGEILGVGTYRERWEENPVFYLRLRAADPDRIAGVLGEKGYTVLGVQQ